MLLTGDFNAQTSDMEDFTSADTFLSEYFEFDENTVELFNQKCVLEKYNRQINSVSQDNKINNSDQRLIDICKTNNMFILTDRFGQDRNVGVMTFRNTSVIDYSIVSSNTFEISSDFRIIEVDRFFSDGHSLLRVDLRTRCNPPTAEHRKQTTVEFY